MAAADFQAWAAAHPINTVGVALGEWEEAGCAACGCFVRSCDCVECSSCEKRVERCDAVRLGGVFAEDVPYCTECAS